MRTWPMKDPAEVVDYEVSWAERLNGDTIATSTFTLVTPAGLTKDDEDSTAGTATVWLSGGTAGLTATILNTITTAGGRTYDEVLEVLITPAAATLTVENGTGVAGAVSYAAIAFIDAYWLARPHDPRATAWRNATSGDKVGGAIEATAFVDSEWGAYFVGRRKDYAQGRAWPRYGEPDPDNAGEFLPLTDAAGVELAPLPELLQVAVAELAPRALEARLAADVDQGQRVKSISEGIAGALNTKVEYFDGGARALRTSYGSVGDLLAPLLNGSQPNAPQPTWLWR